jgi:UDP-glucuronate 4-epimerase
VENRKQISEGREQSLLYAMGANNMNILITGAKGFVGQHLVRQLSRFHNVFTYDLVDGQDIRNLHDLDKAFEYAQCTTVVHLAARTGVRRSVDYPGEYIATNIEGTWNVGKMCERYDCRLINFSSSSVYGLTTPPTPEDAPKHPISLYGMTKLMGEHIVNNLATPTTIIRPFTIYGEGGRGDQVFYKWLNQFKAGKFCTIYNKNTSRRGYTYINDIVKVILKLISMPWDWEHEDFNIGGLEIISIDDLLEIFSENIPGFIAQSTFLPAPMEDTLENYANITKAISMLGYDPPKNLRKNIERIIHNELKPKEVIH